MHRVEKVSGQYRIIGMCGLRRNFSSRFVAKTAGILTDFKVFAANMGGKEQASRTFGYCAVLPQVFSRASKAFLQMLKQELERMGGG